MPSVEKGSVLWSVIYASLLAFALLVFTTPGIRVSDEFSYLLMIDAYATDGSLVLDNGLDIIHSNQQRIPGTTFARIDGPRLAGVPAPLYPVIVAPLYRIFGLWGFAVLNILAYAATAVLVALMARSIKPASRKLSLAAAVLWSAATYSLAYAPMLWPHALSVFLVTAAAYLALSTAKQTHHSPAVLAGLLAGTAIGIRYPNAVYAIVLAGYLIIRYKSRLPAYLLGLMPPLAVVVYLNTLVFHHSFVTGYGNLLVMGVTMLVPAVLLLAAAVGLWFLHRFLAATTRKRSMFPLAAIMAVAILALAFTESASSFLALFLQKTVYAGIEGGHPYPLDKKALLQSTPYLILAVPGILYARKRNASVLLWAALACAGLLVWGPASLGGVNETLGMRYLLETLPFIVLLSLSAVADLRPRLDMKKGVLIAVILFSLFVFSSQPFLLYPKDMNTLPRMLPLTFASGVLGLYSLAREHRTYNTLFWVVFAIAVAWSVSVAYADAVVGARRTSDVTAMSETIDQALPGRAAVLVYGGGEAGLLYQSAITKDIDIYTVANDPGDTQRVVKANIQRGIPVYALYWGDDPPLKEILIELTPTLQEEITVLRIAPEGV